MKRLALAAAFMGAAVLGLTISSPVTVSALPDMERWIDYYDSSSCDNAVGFWESTCEGSNYSWGQRTQYYRENAFSCDTWQRLWYFHPGCPW